MARAALSALPRVAAVPCLLKDKRISVILIDMDNPQISRSRPKEVFLHLLEIITLYISAGALITLFFQYINYFFPLATEYNYGGEFHGAGLIRGAVAALIVAFPVYIGVSILLNKLYVKEPEIRTLRVRRWLLNFTLFLTALIVIGDLISLVWNFLNGELTLRFILKILSIFAVAASVFVYYLIDLKDDAARKGFLKLFGQVVIAVVVIAVAASFFIIGSPLSSRLRNNDSLRVNDLQSIQYDVINFWQAKGVLPAKLDDLNDATRGISIPSDPITHDPYGYSVIGSLSFDLCANFETSNSNIPTPSPAYPASAPRSIDNNWQHGTGETCFHRTIDPSFYPPYPKGIQ